MVWMELRDQKTQKKSYPCHTTMVNNKGIPKENKYTVDSKNHARKSFLT